MSLPPDMLRQLAARGLPAGTAGISEGDESLGGGEALIDSAVSSAGTAEISPLRAGEAAGGRYISSIRSNTESPAGGFESDSQGLGQDCARAGESDPSGIPGDRSGTKR